MIIYLIYSKIYTPNLFSTNLNVKLQKSAFEKLDELFKPSTHYLEN